MKQMVLVGATALALALPSLAEAGEMSGEGIYGEIRGGVNFANDADFDQTALTGELEFDTGYVVELESWRWDFAAMISMIIRLLGCPRRRWI
jgi:hypothetical protein